MASKEKSWRTLGDAERQAIEEVIAADMKHRYAQGRQEYGDTFQGDPLAHAYEEAIDLVFYLQVAIRRRASPSAGG